MQLICRTRRQLVTEGSALKTHIIQLMALFFREFQGLVDPDMLQKQKIFSFFWGWRGRRIVLHCPLPEETMQLGEPGLEQLALAHGFRLKDRGNPAVVKRGTKSFGSTFCRLGPVPG